jgi:hypothetical protein
MKCTVCGRRGKPSSNWFTVRVTQHGPYDVEKKYQFHRKCAVSFFERLQELIK